MNRRALTVAVSFSLAILVHTPRADAQVIIEHASRWLDASVVQPRYDPELDGGYVLVNGGNDSASTDDTGFFDRSVFVTYEGSSGQASQTSSVSSGRFEAHGTTDVYASDDHGAGTGEAACQVTFHTDAAQRYTLVASLVEDGTATGEGFSWTLRVSQLEDDGGSTPVLSVRSTPTPNPVTGVLPAGRYDFLFDIRQTSDYGSRWKYSFQFDLAVVPEPTTLVVLPAGLLPMLRRRRHRVC